MKERQDSNKKRWGMFCCPGRRTWLGEGGVCNRVKGIRKFEVRPPFVSNDLWNDDNE